MKGDTTYDWGGGGGWGVGWGASEELAARKTLPIMMEKKATDLY
jgi:hypothetical protein